jgi:hypothetical protein
MLSVLISSPPWKWVGLISPKLPASFTGIFRGEEKIPFLWF